MINVGIIGCGFVGGALKDWLEHNNPECKLIISDPAKGYNDSMADIDIAFLQINVPTEDDGTQDLTLMKELISALPDVPVFVRTTILPGTSDLLTKETGHRVHYMPEFLTERTHIEKTAAGARFTEDDGATWTDLPGDTIVSMNMWGFTRSFLAETGARFAAFLDNALKTNPLKGEYFLPSVVSQLIAEDKAQVKVLHSRDKWYGVTYKEDKPVVVAAIAEKTAQGLYPDNLWEV